MVALRDYYENKQRVVAAPAPAHPPRGSRHGKRFPQLHASLASSSHGIPLLKKRETMDAQDIQLLDSSSLDTPAPSLLETKPGDSSMTTYIILAFLSLSLSLSFFLSFFIV